MNKTLRYGLVLLAVLIAFVGMYVYSVTRPVANTGSDTIYLKVEQGMNANQIANLLEAKGLISNAETFRIWSKIAQLDNKFEAGEYLIRTDMSMFEIASSLNGDGAVLANRITIPEGYTVRQIAALLDKNGKNGEEFKRLAENYEPYDYMKRTSTSPRKYSVEGFIYPDTYNISPSQTEADILAMLVRQFDAKLTPEIREQITKSGLTIGEAVILASIVEREARFDEERPVIARVFLNRLEHNMPLQSCATVQYLLDKVRPVLTIKDTRISSPYNTYLHAGLPPGPIGCIGDKSLQAVLNPDNNDYLYFVADKDGHHHFGRTYTDHMNNIERIERPE